MSNDIIKYNQEIKGLPEFADKVDMSLIYIYALVDPTSKHIKYVGLSNDPISRYRAHKQGLGFWFDRLRRKGQAPHLYILEVVSFENGIEREQYWIQWFGVDNLFNQHDGSKAQKRKKRSIKRLSGKKLNPTWLTSAWDKSLYHKI